MEKKLKKEEQQKVIAFVACVSTFMQDCQNIALCNSLSTFIAFYFWQFANLTKSRYNEFVSRCIFECEKFGFSNNWDLYKLDY